jgi:hypothetical protein
MYKGLICWLSAKGTPCITQFNKKDHDSSVPYPKQTNFELRNFILNSFSRLRKIWEESNQFDCNRATATRRLIVKECRIFANCTLNIVMLTVQAYRHSRTEVFLSINLKFASPCVIMQFNWINQPDATISPVYYLTFKYSSTCFGCPHAHRQELNNCSSSLWFWRANVLYFV